MMVTERQLGRCNARIKTLTETDIYIETATDSGVILERHFDCDSFDVKLLESYSSIVAICITADDGSQQLYSLPRSNYSTTTQRQVNKFWDEVRSFGIARWNDALTFRIGIEPKRAW